MPNAADEASSDLLTWLRRLAEQPRFGHQDRLGRAHLIDRAARLRGAAAIQDGDVLSMSRPLLPLTHNLRGDSLPSYSVQVFLSEQPWGRTATNHQEMEAHGHTFTHLDCLNHVGVDGTWYSGWPATETAGLSIADFAESGLVTRGVLADIPRCRVAWVPRGQLERRPVAGRQQTVARQPASGRRRRSSGVRCKVPGRGRSVVRVGLGVDVSDDPPQAHQHSRGPLRAPRVLDVVPDRRRVGQL